MEDNKKIDVGGRPPKYENPEELIEAMQKYFEETTPPYTITGLALHLGFESKQSMYDMEKRDGFSYPIKRARTMIENGYEVALASGGGSGIIFALKNFGWIDRQEQEITHSGNLSVYAPKKREDN